LVAAAALLVFAGLDRSSSDDRAVAPAARGKGPRPVAASAFANSVGVNVHLTYTTTPYGNFDRVQAALRDLRIRHVRDGLVLGRPDQEEKLNRLADEGIRSTLIMGAPNASTPADEVAAARRIARAIDAVEGPNEYDVSGDPNWAAKLLRYQRDLYKRVKTDPALRSRPVYGPTVANPSNLQFLGSFRGAMDVPNIHPYPGGGPPERALADNHAALERSTRKRGAVATETGYHNALKGDQSHPGVGARVSADYLPRLLLSSYADGYRRTFLYELVDIAKNPEKPEDNFGLLRSNWRPKPAYKALRNLMHLVSDTGRPRLLRPLRYSLEGDRVDRLLLQKSDGSYLLALWQGADLGHARTARVAPRSHVTLALRSPAAVELYRPSRSMKPRAERRHVRRIAVPVGGDAVLVHIDPAGS
jgi:hypothetical protein